MNVVYGEEAPSYATVKRRAADCRRSIRSLENNPQSGRPSEAVCEQNCRAVENVMMQNCLVNVQLTADTAGTGSAETILHEHLLMTKVCMLGDPDA